MRPGIQSKVLIQPSPRRDAADTLLREPKIWEGETPVSSGKEQADKEESRALSEIRN